MAFIVFLIAVDSRKSDSAKKVQELEGKIEQLEKERELERKVWQLEKELGNKKVPAEKPE